jgi:hypothetical protein
MLVYGDMERVESARGKRDGIVASLEALSRMEPGLDRHAALVAAFIDLSELVQGLADAEFAADGCDRSSPVRQSAMRILMEVAAAVGRSWATNCARLSLPDGATDRLRRLDGPSPVRTRRAEGYAHYALYPESYWEAALRSGLGPETRVVGIRSIGTGLSVLVAAATGSPPPVTVRPVGHPFRREIALDPALARALLDGARTFAVVDEGPGLSGSSFGAVADWLEKRGVARQRIHFFPSHSGDPGPMASDAHRARWADAPRHCMDCDELLLPTGRLRAWLEELLGPLEGSLEEVRAGAWRELHGWNEAEWPAVNLQQERRKFIVHARGVSWLVKFAGLGRDGARTAERAEALSAAGFSAPAAGVRHGFHVERWLGDARPLDLVEVDPHVLIGRVASYLGFRARRFPADGAGADAARLLEMAQHNASIALGEDALRRIRADPAALDALVRPVATDNRMLPHEWLLTPDGSLLKGDALDHSTAHDLVGCQDIAWDVAGTAVEFGLSAEDTAMLARLVAEKAGRPVHSELVAFYGICYPAFRLGACTLAAEAHEGEEAGRLRAAANGYAAALSRAIDIKASSSRER